MLLICGGPPDRYCLVNTEAAEAAEELPSVKVSRLNFQSLALSMILTSETS